MRAVDAVAAFARHQISGKPLPKLSWNHTDRDGKLHLAVTAEPMPKEVKVWRANGDTKDIRDAKWEPRTIEVKDGSITIDEERPTTGVSAFFAELAYQIDDLPYSLCTQLRFVEAPTGAGK
jgi:PhoPQ-activated pathogenicity-related protein